MAKRPLFSPQDTQLLREALALYTANNRESWTPPEEWEEPPVSDRFRRRMERLIRWQRRPVFALVNSAGKRVATVAVALLLSMVVLTCSVEAIREPVTQFIVQTYRKFSQILFDRETKSSELAGPFVQVAPTYIPEGYTQANENYVENSVFTVDYLDNNGNQITYTQINIHQGLGMNVDTENAEVRDIEINGVGGKAISKFGETSLLFATEDYFFDVSGSASDEELIKMAESIPIS